MSGLPVLKKSKFQLNTEFNYYFHTFISLNGPVFSSSGHIEVVKLLASHGAEVSCKDKKSYTPLHAAASSGMISVVKYLLDLGVDVSSKHKIIFHTLQSLPDIIS